MSYSYPIQPFYTRIFNGTTLAIIASLGLHILVLGVALPNISGRTKSNTSELRDVRLIELTEAERSRLPNLETQTPNFSSLYNTPLNDTPLLDSGDLNPSLPSLDTIPPPPSLPSLPALPQLPPMGVYSPPIASLPPTPPPSSLPTPNLPYPPVNSSETFREDAPLNSQPRPNFPPPADSMSPEDITNASINQGQRRREEIERQLRTTNPNIPRINALNPNTPSNPSQSSPSSPTGEQRQRRLLADVLNEAENIQEGLTRNSKNTSLAEATKNDAEWMAANQIALGRNENQITIAGNYPRVACSRQLSGSSIYGIIVDAQGQISDSPTLLKSSGYGILNQQALKDITARSFNNSTGSPQGYRVTVNFNPSPENCPGYNLVQPENNQQEAVNPPATPKLPSVTPSPQTPVNTPANGQPQPVTQPRSPVVEQAPQPTNNQPRTPIVEQAPQPTNNQPRTPVVEQTPQPTNNQPRTPVVEQTPIQENNQTQNSNLKPENLPSSTTESAPSLVQPPSNPASKKPNSVEEEPLTPSTGQRPANLPQPMGNPAIKKPAETDNNVSSNSNTNLVTEP